MLDERLGRTDFDEALVIAGDVSRGVDHSQLDAAGSLHVELQPVTLLAEDQRKEYKYMIIIYRRKERKEKI